MQMSLCAAARSNNTFPYCSGAILDLLALSCGTVNRFVVSERVGRVGLRACGGFRHEWRGQQTDGESRNAGPKSLQEVCTYLSYMECTGIVLKETPRTLRVGT